MPAARLRVPNDLQVTPTRIGRALVVGSCLASGLPAALERLLPPCTCDFLLFNNAMELPAEPPRPVGEYDLQVVQVPLRSVLPESVTMRLSYGDPAAFEDAFALASEALHQLLAAACAYGEGTGLLTLVTNFLVPQGRTLGRLLPGEDLREPAYFVARLNALLAEEVAGRPDTHLVDLDAISASIGRLYVQDDLVWAATHGGVLTDWDYERDLDRITPPAPLSAQHQVRSAEFLAAMVCEIEAIYRSVHRIDEVKLVAVDLDDTVWRGVLAEQGAITTDAREGWPLGIVEALLTLKRRGILLAVVSKNDPANVEAVWDQVFMGTLRLEDFAAVRIGWTPKVEALKEVIEAVNVLASSVVFIDDNPAERAAVALGLPGVRVLGEHHLDLRRILLWSPETQPPSLTDESIRRTEMVRAQVRREEIRTGVSREEFLARLAVTVEAALVSEGDDPRLARIAELVNKTNQFNSTGESWSPDQLAAFCTGGGALHVFQVRDALCDYGLTAVALREGPVVRQLVMSCRVLGLEVERAVLGHLVEHGGDPLSVRVLETGRNRPLRDALAGLGAPVEGEWATVSLGPWASAPGTARLVDTAGRPAGDAAPLGATPATH